MKTTCHFLLLILFLQVHSAFSQSAETIVQANLEAYNERDIETFMSYISEDIEMYNLGDCEPYMKGKEAVEKLYADYFDRSPELHSEIKKRIVFDNKVIDHEYITGANGSSDPFELVFMYEVENDLIVRTTAIRKKQK